MGLLNMYKARREERQTLPTVPGETAERTTLPREHGEEPPPQNLVSEGDSPVSPTNPWGLDADLYQRHASPVLALMEQSRPVSRRSQAEQQKRSARLRLLSDALSQTVQSAGAFRGGAVIPYDNTGVLQSMQNYRQLIADDAEAMQDWRSEKIKNYLSGLGKGATAQDRRDRDDTRMDHDLERDQARRDHDLQRDQERRGFDRPYRDAQRWQGNQRIAIAWENLRRLQEQDATRWGRGGRTPGDRSANKIYDPQDRNTVLFQMSDGEREQAEQMVIQGLSEMMNDPEMSQLLRDKNLLDVRTSLLLVNRQNISSDDRWDLLLKFWDVIPGVKEFLASGEEENTLDPHGLFTPQQSQPRSGSEQSFPQIDEWN